MPKNPVTADALRTFSLGREQILTRLWQLANLPPEATKGTIGGQIKAMQMIVAIENLIPDHRQIAAARKEAQAQAEAEAKAEAAAKTKAQQSNFYVSAWLRKQQAEEQAAASQSSQTPPLNPEDSEPSPNPEIAPAVLDPIVQPNQMSRVPEATGFDFEAHSAPSAQGLYQRGIFKRGR